MVEVSPASIGGSLFSVAVCLRGMDIQKVSHWFPSFSHFIFCFLMLTNFLLFRMYFFSLSHVFV